MTDKPKVNKELIKEYARRKGIIAGEGSFKLEDYLFDKQLTFALDPAPFKIAVTTRRAGKTISCVADLTHTALETPDVICLYITLSRKNAKRLVWPEFKKLNLKFKLNGELNETDLSIKFPNGSYVYVLGASDKTAIEDFRGLAIKKVYLDESQSFPAYIKELIDDVLAPALMDYNGQLILIGTPGPVPSGYFFDLTKNKAWSHHTWSFFDNPRLPFLKRGFTHQFMLDRELTRRGVKKDDPSIQREWFGQWVVDANSLVYHYDKAINNYTTMGPGPWTYILGVDLGFEDSDAIALLAYSESSPTTYLVEETVTKHQDITSLANQIEDYRTRYNISKIVMDTGGLGKKVAEEITRRFKIPIEAADKIRKMEYIELMNDALRTGRLMAKEDSLFAQDSNKVEWDHDRSTPDRKIISNRFHSDICEAVLYAWRESYSFTYQAPTLEPEFGTPEWYQKQADLHLQEKIDQMQETQEEQGYGLRAELQMPDINLDDLQRGDRGHIRYQKAFDDRIKKKSQP